MSPGLFCRFHTSPLARYIPYLLIFALVLTAGILPACSPESNTLVLATTTSTYDSGLLDFVLPSFEKENKVKVKVVAAGTGQAIALGEKGDADILLVHDRAKEDKFVAQGYGVDRRAVMYNDFVIVGPENDPAGVKDSKEAAQAFSRIHQTRASFVSRGDDSGTHGKEKQVWAQAQLTPRGTWYISAGQGMAATLIMANEKQAYTLTDRGTYLSFKARLNLLILLQGDPLLLNKYGIIAVNPQKHPNANYRMARKLIEFMTSIETQKAIGDFGRDKYGDPLFYPDSEEWHKYKEK